MDGKGYPVNVGGPGGVSFAPMNRIDVRPVPLRAPARPRPALTFVHSAELARLFQAGQARMRHGASPGLGAWAEVRLEREFIDARAGSDTEGARIWAAQWLPVLVDDSLPRWGMWDVLGFFLAHAAIPNPSPTPNVG